MRSCVRTTRLLVSAAMSLRVLVENILTVNDLETVAKRVLAEMKRPFDIFGHPIQAGASIGAAMAGPITPPPICSIRDADFAMYRAKQSGGGRYEIFDKHLEVVVTSQQERERELRYRLDKRLLEFLYQPVFRLRDGRLEGFECHVALARSRRLCRQLRRPACRCRGDRTFNHPGPRDHGSGMLAVAQLAQCITRTWTSRCA